jgi:hypothetical protein
MKLAMAVTVVREQSQNGIALHRQDHAHEQIGEIRGEERCANNSGRIVGSQIGIRQHPAVQGAVEH